MALNLVEMPTEKKDRADSVIFVLEDMLARARRGEIESLEIVFSMPGGDWGSTASLAVDVRSNASMLMELAMRRLGFKCDDAT
jgi:hypothetical protein